MSYRVELTNTNIVNPLTGEESSMPMIFDEGSTPGVVILDRDGDSVLYNGTPISFSDFRTIYNTKTKDIILRDSHKEYRLVMVSPESAGDHAKFSQTIDDFLFQRDWNGRSIYEHRYQVIQNPVDSEAREEITQVKDSLTELNEDIYSVTPAGEEWSIMDGTSESGWIHKNTHATQDASNPNTEHIIYTDIVGGDTYRYSSNGGGNCCAVLWLDSSDNYISFVDFTVTFRYETVEVVAPTNATKAIVNAMDKTKGTTRFEHYASTGEVKTVKLADKGDVNLYEESRKALIINSQLGNDYAWKTPNKLYVSFVFDDTNRDIDLIEELFRSKNMPVCFATVPSRLDNVCTNGEKARTVLLRAQTNGGEILSHWDSPLTSESTDEDYYNVIVGSKRTLVNAGFNVNGLIVAGGTNYDTQDFVKDIELARPYYKYSDLIANGHVDVEQFYNLRQFLTTNTATNRGYIDTFIANGEIANHGKKGWIIFASHGANDSVTIPIISDLLDYIASKGTDVIEVVNCNTAYEKGRTSKIAKEYANETFIANSSTFSTPLKFIKSGKFVSINMRDVPFSVTVPTGWKTSGIMPTLPSNFMPTENINVQLTTNAGQYGTIVINSAGQATLYTSTEKTSGSNTNIVGSWVAK